MFTISRRSGAASYAYVGLLCSVDSFALSSPTSALGSLASLPPLSPLFTHTHHMQLAI